MVMRRALSDEAKAQRRKDLLMAALDVFFEKGFAAAKMDEIAKRAGVSKGTLYLYFSSKEALFQAQIETIALPKVMLIEGILNGGSAREGLHRFMTMMPKMVLKSPLLRLLKVLMSDAGNFPDIAMSYRKQVVERVLATLTAFLRKANDDGEFYVPNPEINARLIVAPMMLSVIWQLIFAINGDDSMDLEALFQEHERMLLRALCADIGGGT